MITQIRVDGVKSFVGFQLDVPPSLIMLGPNWRRKSNLFDALRLVAGSVMHGFEGTVANDPRLSPKGLFHRGGPDGRSEQSGGARTACSRDADILVLHTGLKVLEKVPSYRVWREATEEALKPRYL